MGKRVRSNYASRYWIDFICTEKELFTFLTFKVSEFAFKLSVYAALTEMVVPVGNNNPVMPSCNHEEADTRLVRIAHTACAGAGIEEN